ncbi:hypothetical protein E1A91_A02G111600v1, partial [Gossypium mustelinum]
FRLSSRVGDKRTRIIDIHHRLTTFIVLCSLKGNSSQNLKDPAIKKPRTENNFPPFDSLVLRMLVLRMSDCPSLNFTAQLESGQLMHSTY